MYYRVLVFKETLSKPNEIHLFSKEFVALDFYNQVSMVCYAAKLEEKVGYKWLYKRSSCNLLNHN